jgi:hypothetical protein
MRIDQSIFLDTSVLKASVDSIPVLVARRERCVWGDKETVINVHRPALMNQNAELLKNNPERFQDTVALRFLAQFAKEGKIKLMTHPEVMHELWGLPRTTGSPLFFGAPIEKVEGPFRIARVVLDWTGTDHQYEFLRQVQHPRFAELQRVCGAYQGPDTPLNRNQLIDAWHVLCAESAGARYFLTHDDKLIRSLTGNRRRPATALWPITPTVLLRALIANNPMWLWSLLREWRKQKKSGRQLAKPMQECDWWR